ncbi:MAG TPA: NAD-dependent epimerase/dehydratase family protein [Spirochaetota bacterium]|nr:NAD-dependent epimerase/dehydratase family protein [Spirochaetota bacterium]
MNAIITGATGLTGSLLTKKLALAEEFRSVTALVRRVPGDKPGNVDYKRIKFETIESEKFKGDIAFSCLGTTIKAAGDREIFKKIDFGYNLDFAKACRKNGIEKFVLLSALGADPDSKIFYNRIKGELEREITLLGFKHLSIIRPSLLDGPRTEWRTGELIARRIMKFINPFLTGRLKKYRSVDIEKVTNIMLQEAFREVPGIKIVENNEIISA